VPPSYRVTNKLSSSDNEAPDADRMLVSSKHMTLASPIFKAMLRTGTFSEGQELARRGKAEINLPEDDPTAFTILLNVIHGHGSRLPFIVDLGNPGRQIPDARCSILGVKRIHRWVVEASVSYDIQPGCSPVDRGFLCFWTTCIVQDSNFARNFRM
jgi:hypothetical protein